MVNTLVNLQLRSQCCLQYTGHRYDKKADIWALGCILYELVCLQKTFEGTNLPSLINKIVKVKYVPIQRKGISNNLIQLIRDLLQRDPDRRPYAHEVLETVDDLMYKSQCELLGGQNDIVCDVVSGAITNGFGIGFNRMQQ